MLGFLGITSPVEAIESSDATQVSIEETNETTGEEATEEVTEEVTETLKEENAISVFSTATLEEITYAVSCVFPGETQTIYATVSGLANVNQITLVYAGTYDYQTKEVPCGYIGGGQYKGTIGASQLFWDGTYQLKKCYYMENGVKKEITLSLEEGASFQKNSKPIYINKITIETPQSLYVGQAKEVPYVILPEDATRKEVRIISSNSEVVEITADGKMKGKKDGAAIVTVASTDTSRVEDSVTVIVSTPKLEKVSFYDSTMKVRKGETILLEPTFYPEYAQITSKTYTSSDSSVVSVTNSGKITAKKKGSAVITLTVNQTVKAYVTVVVSDELCIVLDPGHGGNDCGAVNSKKRLVERDINQKIANKLRKELEKYDGVVVYMTHGTMPKSSSMSLDSRAAFAKTVDADVLISLHINAGSTTARGAEVYIPRQKYHSQMKGLGTSIMRELTSVGLNNRGVKIRTTSSGTRYADGSLADYYGIIRNSVKRKFPGIIIEHAFISSSDYRFLNSNAKINRLAMADLKGIVKYYDLKKSNTPKTKVNRIALNYKSKTVKKNSFVKLTAYVTPSTAIQKSVTWSSNNQKVAKVNQSGLVRAVGVGQTTIKATAKDGSGQCAYFSIYVTK